jgi:hypothetical protein
MEASFTDRRLGRERRESPRQAYSRYIFFATRKQFFEGELANYSDKGLFIKSHAFLPVGEKITVALPYSEEKAAKRKAKIVWCNEEGFGAELEGGAPR